METINVEVRVSQLVDAEIGLVDIFNAINELPMVRRWSIIASILNAVKLDVTDTTEEQREKIKEYLQEKISFFNSEIPQKPKKLRLGQFIVCFKNTKDANLLYRRYRECNYDYETFKNSLVDIDRWKFERYFEGGAK